MIITNMESVPGKQITTEVGLVRGNTVRAKHIGRDIAASLKGIIGGEIKGYVEAMTEAREEATERMIQEAEELDADAIVNIRYATSQVMGNAAEILVYGTAVKLTDE